MLKVRLGLIAFFIGYIAGFTGLGAFHKNKGEVLSAEIQTYSVEELSQDIGETDIGAIAQDEEITQPDQKEIIVVLTPTSSQKEVSTEPVQEILVNEPTTTPTQTILPTATPTILPEPTATPMPLVVEIAAPADLEPLFSEFSTLYGVDANILKKIADCESHFNPGVVAGPYAGMYQFTEGTWTSYRKWMGEDVNSNLRFGAREAIQTAAFAISQGKANILWPACSK